MRPRARRLTPAALLLKTRRPSGIRPEPGESYPAHRKAHGRDTPGRGRTQPLARTALLAENPATVRHSPRTRRIPIRHIARPTGATRQAAAEPSRSPAASRPFVKRERTAVCGASSQLAESILMSTPVRLALNAELRPGSRPRNECRALAAKRPRNASLSILQILLDSASHASLQ